MEDEEEVEVELTELQKEYRKKRMANPAIYGNPIWEQEGGTTQSHAVRWDKVSTY